MSTFSAALTKDILPQRDEHKAQRRRGKEENMGRNCFFSQLGIAGGGEDSEIRLYHKIHSNQEIILSLEKVVWTSLSVLLSSRKNTREAFPPTLRDTMSITF